MFQMEYVKLAQRNYVANRYMVQKAKTEAKRKKRMICALFTACALSLSMTIVLSAKADAQTTDQEFIIRYGRAWNWGNQVQLDDDRSIVDVIDPPEFAEGTNVRVLFKTNGTLNYDDDEIVDVTEY